MRDLYTALLLSVSVTGAAAQSTIGPAILHKADDAQLMGVFPSLALAADPGSGMAQTWNFTAIPEPDGRCLRPWTGDTDGPSPCDTVLFAFDRQHVERSFTDRQEPPFDRIGSTTRTWSYDAAGDIEFSWATYKRVVRVKVVTVDSNFTLNEQTTTARYLWLMADTGEPVLEVSRRDGGPNAHAPGRFDVAAIYEEGGITAGAGATANSAGAVVHRSSRSGLVADQVSVPLAGAAPAEH
jgi:hypothetical protein